MNPVKKKDYGYKFSEKDRRVILRKVKKSNLDLDYKTIDKTIEKLIQDIFKSEKPKQLIQIFILKLPNNPN